ncbi:MAG: protein kinase [Planctomycetales bacterium]|nr:protein kinase [Planctomycetales bacterium]
MTTVNKESSQRVNQEPIPGIKLIERIGVGGFGEVWSATTPGDILKAVKIIHGLVDDDRGLRELRTLDRAKSLKHPFLLSMERVEIVDNQLYIITELADKTLLERCDECRKEGLPGIPKEELLQYMSEAADALDYLFNRHAFQHLDVKPENLLLVDSHIKVADFGLMKDLQKSCVSMVGGLTPHYSAPEVFDGKPTAYSDQYSLAIVYVRLLTGAFPFAGNSVASLASQHLNSSPDLTSLTPVERFAVGKALSKTPERRFQNCREFVDRLMHRSSATFIMNDPPDTDATGDSQSKSKRSAKQQNDQVHDGCTVLIQAPEVRKLPRLDIEDTQPTFRPTIFIGIGETGGRILRSVRRLISDRVAPIEDTPALQFLYIDTDTDSLSEVKLGQRDDGLREQDILILPLRETSYYRNSSISNIESLSRRWLYNVPRTLHTHGIRALGRIAMLDHATSLMRHMREIIGESTDSKSIETTAQNTNLKFEETDPRVFVVASICGGTGSGMVIDVAYGLRQMLAECGFSDEHVVGILTCAHAAGQSASAHGLSYANAFACLDELNYFSQPGCDYPGEPSLGLAGFRENGPTFSNTYLFDFGSKLKNADFSESVDHVAEYLFANSLSTACSVFEKCRESADPRVEPLIFRSSKMRSFTTIPEDQHRQLADQLCRYVVRKWKVGIDAATIDEQTKLTDVDRLLNLGDSEVASQTSNKIVELSQQELSRLGIETNDLSERISKSVDSSLASDSETYLRDLIDSSLNAIQSGESQPRSNREAIDVVIKRIKTVVGERQQSQGDAQIETLANIVVSEAEIVGSTLSGDLTSWIKELVDTGYARVDGASQAANWLSDHLKTILTEVTRELIRTRDELHTSEQRVAELPLNAKKRIREADQRILADALVVVAERAFHVLILECVSAILETIRSSLHSAKLHLRDLWKDLTQLGDEFLIASVIEGDPNESVERDQVVCLEEVFSARQIELIEQLDRFVEELFVNTNRRLSDVLSHGGSSRRELVTSMRMMARKLILSVCDEETAAKFQHALEQNDSVELARLVSNRIENATPSLLEHGGGSRLFILGPDNVDAKKLGGMLEELCDSDINVIVDGGRNLRVCCEAQDIPLSGIKDNFVREHFECQEMASRLHTRINVDWDIV